MLKTILPLAIWLKVVKLALARDGVDEIKEVAPDCIYSTPAANAAGGTNAVIFKDHQQ